MRTSRSSSGRPVAAPCSISRTTLSVITIGIANALRIESGSPVAGRLITTLESRTSSLSSSVRQLEKVICLILFRLRLVEQFAHLRSPELQHFRHLAFADQALFRRIDREQEKP